MKQIKERIGWLNNTLGNGLTVTDVRKMGKEKGEETILNKREK